MRTERAYPGNCTADIPYMYSSVLLSAADVKTRVPQLAGVGKSDRGIRPLGRAPHSRGRLRARELRGERERGDHSAGVGVAAPGDVVRRAVIDARSRNRSPIVTFTASPNATSFIGIVA